MPRAGSLVGAELGLHNSNSGLLPPAVVRLARRAGEHISGGVVLHFSFRRVSGWASVKQGGKSLGRRFEPSHLKQNKSTAGVVNILWGHQPRFLAAGDLLSPRNAS